MLRGSDIVSDHRGRFSAPSSSDIKTWRDLLSLLVQCIQFAKKVDDNDSSIKLLTRIKFEKWDVDAEWSSHDNLNILSFPFISSHFIMPLSFKAKKLLKWTWEEGVDWVRHWYSSASDNSIVGRSFWLGPLERMVKWLNSRASRASRDGRACSEHAKFL